MDNRCVASEIISVTLPLQQTSPFEQLPTELICTIFRSVLDSDPQVSDSDLRTLLVVCKSFKSIVLADPRLWANISIRNTAGLCPFDVASLKNRLRRSKAALIDVTLECTEPDEEDEAVDGESSPEGGRELPEAYLDSLRTTGDLIHSNLSRIRHLSMSLNAPTEAEIIFPLPYSMPSVKSLALDFLDGTPNNKDFALMSPDAICAPEEFSLIASCASPSLLSSISPDNLISLNINVGTSMDEAIADLLGRSRNLREASIRDCPPISPSRRTILPKVDTPFLHSLEIPGHVLLDNVGAWSAPHLHHLTIHPQLGAWRSPSLISFPSLRTLTITSRKPYVADIKFADILVSLPNLVAIDVPSYEQPALRMLELLVPAPPISPAAGLSPTIIVHCPNLVIFRIRAYLDGFPALVPALRTFIEARSVKVASGREVRRVELAVLVKKQKSACDLREEYPERVHVVTNPTPLHSVALL